MRTESYADVRDDMLPGDVIAFSGKGRVSNLIKRFTFAPVSHVGVVRHAQTRADAKGGLTRYFNELAESTSLAGRAGVFSKRLSTRLAAYDGEVWWLPLRDVARAALDESAYFGWLYGQEGKEYDFFGAAASVLEEIPLLGAAAGEDFGKLFCSELAAGALEAGGVLPAGTNASGVTPIELCRLAIYGDVVQLKGPPKEIPRVNTIPPGTLVAA